MSEILSQCGEILLALCHLNYFIFITQHMWWWCPTAAVNLKKSNFSFLSFPLWSIRFISQCISYLFLTFFTLLFIFLSSPVFTLFLTPIFCIFYHHNEWIHSLFLVPTFSLQFCQLHIFPPSPSCTDACALQFSLPFISFFSFPPFFYWFFPSSHLPVLFTPF